MAESDLVPAPDPHEVDSSEPEPDVSRPLSIFDRWPSCEHCGQRMLMTRVTERAYMFICFDCPTRARIPT